MEQGRVVVSEKTRAPEDTIGRKVQMKKMTDIENLVGLTHFGNDR